MSVHDVVLYVTRTCPWCARAKQLLARKGVTPRIVDVTGDVAARDELVRRSGRTTVPQLFIDGEPLGGYDDMAELDRAGQLDVLLGLPSGTET